jgi:integrase
MKHSNCSTEKPDEQAIAVARWQHCNDLAATAAKLLKPPVDHSRVFADCDWTLDDADPYLSQCLASHLEAEFPSVSWPRDFDASTRADIKLRDILRLVSRRRTFVGTCEICKGWQETPEDPPAVELKTQDVVEAFLSSKRVAEKSKESYHHTLNVFVKHCPVLPSAPEEIEQYLTRVFARTGKPISERTAAGNHTVLKMLYRFANERHDFPNVMEKIRKPVFKEKEARAFTREEAKAILAEAAKNETHLALIHLHLGHGWRPEEGVRATVGDDGETEILVRGKKRSESMPLLPETKELLAKLANGRKPGEPFFISQMKRRISDRQLYNVVKGLLRRAGVLEGKPVDLRMATHALRKTFSSLMLEAGCEGRIVQRLLRHEKRDITDRYLDISKGMLRQALERYSPLRLLNGNQPQTTAELPKIFSCST